uniref:Uncharacterized protein n=1 Tax=Oryza brachyantha TaxID=4533 RepID=J3MBU0_ORYBR
MAKKPADLKPKKKENQLQERVADLGDPGPPVALPHAAIPLLRPCHWRRRNLLVARRDETRRDRAKIEDMEKSSWLAPSMGPWVSPWEEQGLHLGKSMQDGTESSPKDKNLQIYAIAAAAAPAPAEASSLMHCLCLLSCLPACAAQLCVCASSELCKIV